ncbi:T9SS type A sorting domain-containing protein [bacterium]|nr:T9SS type A sorting domain-containing protein [bacterium]
MKKIGTSVSVIMLLAICLFGMLQMGFQPPAPLGWCCDTHGYNGMTTSACSSQPDVTKDNFGYEGSISCQACVDDWNDDGTYACQNCGQWYQYYVDHPDPNFDVDVWECFVGAGEANVTTCAAYIGSPTLSVTQLTTYLSQGTNNNAFYVTNTGSGSLSYTNTDSKSWVTDINPDVGIVNTYEKDYAAITVDQNLMSVADLANSTNSVIVTTSSAYGNTSKTYYFNTIAPSAPGNLMVTNSGSWGNPPQLSWSDVNYECGYKVYRKINSGSWSQIATRNNDVTTYTDYDYELSKFGDIIYYYVTSWNGGGSAQSNTTSTIGTGNQAHPDGNDLAINLMETGSNESKLGNCFPNPGNPGTSISFQIAEAGKVDLKVVNIRGAVVRTLVTGTQPSGRHQVHWDGRNEHGNVVGTGMYFFILQTGGRTFYTKYSLIK